MFIHINFYLGYKSIILTVRYPWDYNTRNTNSTYHDGITTTSFRKLDRKKH